MPLRRATLGCHVLLVATLVASVLPPVTALQLVIAAVIVLPLLLTAHGLSTGRRAIEQRLAVLLVVYIGGASVEVVAQAGDAPMLSGALLFAVLELGLLLALIRREAPSARGARE
jgi:hypothetical protein